MRIECSSENLKKLLSFAERFLGKNTTLPVLSGVLFSVEDKSILIKATNLEMGLEAELPAKTTNTGSFVLYPQVLINILSSFTTPKTVVLEEKNGNITFLGGGNKAIIKCIPSDDFPLLPQKPKENKQTINKKDFLLGLKAVYFSAAISNIKPEISSVYVYPEGRTIVFVATDSVRLAEKKVATKKDGDFSPFILPLKATIELIKICEADIETQEIDIFHNDNQISFLFKNVHISSRLINGNFPDYRQIIPKTTTTEIIILKEDLLNALKIANAFSDKFHKILVSAQPKQKKLSLISENPDIGRNETTLDVVLEGDPIEIGFNQKNIIDCVSTIPQNSVVLGFAGQGKPLVIKGVGDASFTYLVAPLSS